MTSPLIPDFIFRLFEKEVTKINLTIVETMCDLYGIDLHDAQSKLSKELNINFNIISEDIEQIKIVKKQQAGRREQKTENNASTSNDRSLAYHASPKLECCARVFVQSDLVVKQCSRFQIPESTFCKMHQQQFDGGKLKYGTIHDPKPECISTAKLNMKVRKKIY
jgi:hypothetical protein